jgi:hypothetical protein
MCPMCITAAVLVAAKTTTAGSAATVLVKELVWPKREADRGRSSPNIVSQQTNTEYRKGEMQ